MLYSITSFNRNAEIYSSARAHRTGNMRCHWMHLPTISPSHSRLPSLFSAANLLAASSSKHHHTYIYHGPRRKLEVCPHTLPNKLLQRFGRSQRRPWTNRVARRFPSPKFAFSAVRVRLGKRSPQLYQGSPHRQGRPHSTVRKRSGR